MPATLARVSGPLSAAAVAGPAVEPLAIPATVLPPRDVVPVGERPPAERAAPLRGTTPVIRVALPLPLIGKQPRLAGAGARATAARKGRRQAHGRFADLARLDHLRHRRSLQTPSSYALRGLFARPILAHRATCKASIKFRSSPTHRPPCIGSPNNVRRPSSPRGRRAAAEDAPAHERSTAIGTTVMRAGKRSACRQNT